MKLDHVAINVKDINESVRWYVEKLQAKIKYQDETWAMLDCGGIKLALTISEQHPPHIAFCVENLQDIPGAPKYHRDGSAYVYNTDPDGNVIEYVYWYVHLGMLVFVPTVKNHHSSLCRNL